MPCTFDSMMHQGSTVPASILPLLARWRLSVPEQRPALLAQALRVEAQRCFRLARGIVSFELLTSSKRSAAPSRARPGSWRATIYLLATNP